jgi:TM2 domain-containing membrane protein YozV
MVAADMFDYTRKAFWGGPWYSYWMLMVATIFFGFFGVDHFLLKSPMTGALKFLVNILGFGIWYFYDMIQILGDKETVKQHGLTIPLVGAAGIGAGACVDDQPGETQGKSPLRLLAYLFLVLMPFGMDSLVGGDSKGAAAKFITTVFPLFWPVAMLWGVVSIGRAFFMPRTLFTEGLVRPFPVSWFMDPRGPNKLGPVDLPVEGAEGCDRGGGFFTWILGLVGAVFPGVFPAVTAVTGATTAVAGTVQAGAETASAALGVAKKGIETVEKVALPLVESGAAAVAQTGAVAGAVGQQLSAFTDPTRLAQMAVQRGGGGSDDGMATTGLFLLFAGILAGGTYFAAKRLNLSWKGVTRENGSNQGQQRNDSPPQPHGV